MKLNIAKQKSGEIISLHSSMLTRHGLITGATGTGKTVTVKLLAEKMAEIGSSVFLIDVKGDLNGFCEEGENSSGFKGFLEKHGLEEPVFGEFPTQFWDLFSEKGLPIRATVSDLGPELMAKLLCLNENQNNLLHTIFRIADEQGLLLLDFKDLTQMTKYLYENNKEFEADYGALNKQSLGAIQRAMIVLEQNGIDNFFGEETLLMSDIINPSGVINVLNASKMIVNSKLYSTFLLWLLSEIYEAFDEVGEVEIPRLMLFFDEAHLMFKDISPVLLSKIEQVIKLIRSKGIGIFFISQSPVDIPESIASQLGNRIQHGIRAYTKKELQRQNGDKEFFERALNLGVGEVFISSLSSDGIPSEYFEAVMLPPQSKIGRAVECNYFNNQELVRRYLKPLDRTSAYEILIKRQNNSVNINLPKTTRTPNIQRGRKPDTMMTKLAKSMFSSFGRSLGNSLARGVMGTLKK